MTWLSGCAVKWSIMYPFMSCRQPNSCMTRIVILSNDTDVFVVAMYFYYLLAANGLAELWLRGGVGDKTWFIPLHVIAVKVGKPICEVLPATHALTCYDSTSKFGWKLLALRPSLYCTWRTLGDDMQMCRTVCRMLRSSWYRCWTEGNMALKRWIIYVSTGTIIASQWLLPTYPQPVMLQKVIFRVHSMQPTRKSIAWETSLNPQEYGFTMESQCRVSKKCHRNLPDEVSLKCNCLKSATRPVLV